MAEYRKFARTMKPDGIKTRLREPDDEVFQKLTKGSTHPA